MEGQKVTDQFIEYIIKSGKTKLTADLLFDEFKNSGYYTKCIESVTDDLKKIVDYWGPAQWKMYIYNYTKLQLGLKAIATDNKEYTKILA